MIQYNYRFYLISGKEISIKIMQSPSKVLELMDNGEKYMVLIDIHNVWHTIVKSQIEYFVCEN